MDTANCYRVTGFNGETKIEYNIGLFLAETREDAIRQAQQREPEQTKASVLDAALSK
jgi:hypothetical protein